MNKDHVTRTIVALILCSCMLVFPIAARETDIPTADYELVFGEESSESESMDIISSSYSPVSSVLVTNESVMDPLNLWNAIHFPGSDSNYYAKVVNVPYLNVSDLVLTITAYVVEGPLELSMKENSTIGQTGDYCKIVVHEVPEVNPLHPEIASTDYVRITFDSTDWQAIDEIYFSIEAIFTEIVCPVTIDLQRTDGERMGLLPEFRAIYDYNAVPTLYIGDYPFIIMNPNITIYIPNANYSVSFHWLDYSYSFSKLTVLNESLKIELRIRSVRLNVIALQKIPFIAIDIEFSRNGMDTMYERIMTKDSPSFFLPSEQTVHITVTGGPPTMQYKHHFNFYLDAGGNRNISLSVDENWIILGNAAFTPARLMMYLSSIFVCILVIAIARREIATSLVYAPFLLQFAGSLLPFASMTVEQYRSPMTYPLYSLYTESTSTSLTFASMRATLDDSISTVSSIGILNETIVSSISFFILSMAFFGLIIEILREEESEMQEVLSLLAIMSMPIMHWVYFDYISRGQAISLGVGFYVTVAAAVMWFIQLVRRNRYAKSQQENLSLSKKAQ